jgi:hypothetical protein
VALRSLKKNSIPVGGLIEITPANHVKSQEFQDGGN